MCGLVGVAGNLDKDWNRVFRNMLLFDVVRGFDSTGVGRVTNAGHDMVVHKELGTPTEELWNKGTWCDYKGVPHNMNRVLMGHNRAATLGKITKDNAHPFTFEHITGAHNGTLRQYDDLHLSKEYEVDSMSLIHNIAQNGIKHTWENFHGAAALSWWDKKTQTLHFIRNKERPLHFALGKKGTVLIWASERWMIEAACVQAGAKIDKKVDDNGNETHELDVWSMLEHHHHVYKPTMHSCDLEEVEELSPKKGPEVKKYAAGFTTSRGGWSNGTTTTHEQYDPYNGGKGFNWGWGKPLNKAERGMVEGRPFKLTSSCNYKSVISDSTVHIIQGAFLDGAKEQVQVYPETMEEWKMYREAIISGALKDTVFATNTRARQREGYLGGKTTPFCYCIPGKRLEVLEGVGPKKSKRYLNRFNELTDNAEEADNHLKAVSNCCSWCDKELTIDSRYVYVYHGGAAICEECNTNYPDIVGTFGGDVRKCQ